MSNKRTEKYSFALNAAASSSGVIGKLLEIMGREIRQGIGLEPTPEIFDGVEFRRIWGKEKDVKPGRLAGKGPNLFRPVGQGSVPDDNHGSFNLAFELPQKSPHMIGVEVGVAKESEIEFHPFPAGGYGQRRDGRNFLVRSSPLGQNRRIPPRRPASADQRRHKKTAFVYEDDGGFDPRGFFFMRGHSCFIQVLIRSSSRSLACRRGFCGVQPSERKSLATW